MVNWDYLRDNITELTINTTEIQDPYTIPANMINKADETSDGFLGLAIMLPVFLVLVFTIFRDDGDIRFDFLRSIVFASGFTSILGIIMLVSNITSSFVHVMWFLFIFIISTISLILGKKKGL